MSKTTTSTISLNLPEFPYSPAPAARTPLSPLLSSSHFVTTLVSPPPNPSSPSAETPPSSSPSDPADANQEDYAEFFSAPVSPAPASPSPSFRPSSAPVEHLSAPIDPLLLQNLKQPLRSAGSSKRPSSFLSARRLRSSKKFFPSSPSIVKETTSALIEARDRGSLTTTRRCNSSWRRFKRMGNRIATPFRSLGICITGGAMAFSDDRTSGASSPVSSWCSSGEYPAEYIRAILENNVLLGHLTVD